MKAATMSDQLSNDLASLRIDRDPPKRTGGGTAGSVVVRAVVAVAVVGALGAGGVVGWPYVEGRVFKTEVSVGQIVAVSPAQEQTTLTAAGFVVARRLSKVASKTAGRVARVHVVEGQEVHEGDVLVELDASDQTSAIASAHARVMAAQARVAQARAAVQENQTQLDRGNRLAAQGAVTRSSVEDLAARAQVLASAITVAQAEVRSAQAEVAALEVGRGNLTITAPISGTVITKPVEMGEVVTPQMEVLQLADFASLVVEVDVPEGRLGIVRIGAPCEIVLDAFPGRRFRGLTHEVGRRVNRSKAAVPVRVTFDEPATDVLPDMSAHVSFLREALSDTQLRAAERIVVPARAVTARHGQQVVFVIEDGAVAQRSVRLGETTPDGRVVLDGPVAGSRVVLDPPATLQGGQSVKEKDQ